MNEQSSIRSARHYFEDRLKRYPGNARAHKHLAPLTGAQKDWKTSLRHHRAAVEYNPLDVDARNDYAVALLKCGRWDHCVEELKRALQIQPNHVCVHKTISAAYARKGRYKEATTHAREAVRLDPTDAQAHRNLAKLYDVRGNTRDSLKHNRLAVLRGPGRNCVSDPHDTEVYRRVAIQSVSQGETRQGHAEDYYHAYRALAGKRVALANSEFTKELLSKSHTAPELTY